MTEMNEDRKIPGEIAAIFERYYSYDKLMKCYADCYFGFRKSVKCARKAVYYRSLFWRKVYFLYPDLGEDEIVYNQRQLTICIKKKS